MLAMAPARMLAPLLALDAAGPISSKAQLRLLALLVQREFPGTAHGGGYEAEAGRYGPRCGALDRDASGSPSLVEHRIVPPAAGACRFSHVYRITGRGAESVGSLESGADPGELASARRRIGELCADMPVALLEEAYGKLGPSTGTAQLEEAVARGLERTTPIIRGIYRAAASSRALSALAMLDTVRMAISEPKARASGEAQWRVVLCLSGEIVSECDGLAGHLPIPDDRAIVPRLADADDLASNLATYCEKKGIMRDPLAMQLKEMISADKALALCEEMEKVLERP